MNMFGIPHDNIKTIERLHFELFKMIQKNRNNPIITYNHPLNPERSLSYASLPQGSSKISNFRRAKVINEIIHSNNTSKEEDRDDFVNRVLTTIDIKYNEEFVN